MRGALNRVRPLLDFIGCHVIDKLAQEKISPCCQKCADQHNRNDTDQNPRHNEAVPDPPQNLRSSFGPVRKTKTMATTMNRKRTRAAPESSVPRGADQRKARRKNKTTMKALSVRESRLRRSLNVLVSAILGGTYPRMFRTLNQRLCD